MLGSQQKWTGANVSRRGCGVRARPQIRRCRAAAACDVQPLHVTGVCMVLPADAWWPGSRHCTAMQKLAKQDRRVLRGSPPVGVDHHPGGLGAVHGSQVADDEPAGQLPLSCSSPPSQEQVEVLPSTRLAHTSASIYISQRQRSNVIVHAVCIWARLWGRTGTGQSLGQSRSQWTWPGSGLGHGRKSTTPQRAGARRHPGSWLSC